MSAAGGFRWLIYMRWHLKLAHRLQTLRPRELALIDACVIGLASGLSAYLLKDGARLLGTWRVHEAERLPATVVLPAIGLVGGLIAGWLVESVAPEATGSGIPQVKAVLARLPVKLNLRVALVKLAGGILALGSGMPLGREGPTVHVGAGLASQLSKITVSSPERRRQLIAAGAGAGLAAAFNAPIAGFLFVLEELLRDVSAQMVGLAIVACFVAAVVSRLMGVHSLDIRFSEIPTTSSFSLVDIPFFVLLGAVSGVLGALFNKLLIATMHVNFHLMKLPMRWRVALAGLVTGLIVAHLPAAFRDNAGLREMIVTGAADWRLAAVAFVAQFAIVLIDYGSGAPGGLFGPSVSLGAGLGYLMGSLEQGFLPAATPGTYALVGMGTFFTAVCRVPMTAIVIVFEMTHNFNIVLPLMIGCVVSFSVGELVCRGSIYDRLLKFSGIDLGKRSPAAEALSAITAAELMHKEVVTLDGTASVQEALEKFKISRHRGFPVLADGKLAGVVTQTDFIELRDRGLTADAPVSEIMSPDPVTVKPDDSLADLLYRFDAEKLTLIPVVDGDRLVGIISRSDILNAIAGAIRQAE